MNVKFHYSPPAEVHLLSIGGDGATLATVTRGYSQEYNYFITDDEVTKFLSDLESTKLQTPNAFVTMVWLLKNVTRNFEQQLTRYRVGTAFVCESLRFSDKRNAEFYCKMKTERGRSIYRTSMAAAIEEYEMLIANGEATQDSRDVLPGSICTHLFFSCNLQTLAHIYAQRACCQAQSEEWGAVLGQMSSLLQEQAPALQKFLKAPWEDKKCISCGFGASFDRTCSNQNLFDQNLEEQIRTRKLHAWAYNEQEHNEAVT